MKKIEELGWARYRRLVDQWEAMKGEWDGKNKQKELEIVQVQDEMLILFEDLMNEAGE